MTGIIIEISGHIQKLVVYSDTRSSCVEDTKENVVDRKKGKEEWGKKNEKKHAKSNHFQRH